MHEDMYAEICKFGCLLGFMEEGIQLWGEIQNTVYGCHRLHRAEKSAKGFQNGQH